MDEIKVDLPTDKRLPCFITHLEMGGTRIKFKEPLLIPAESDLLWKLRKAVQADPFTTEPLAVYDIAFK